MKKRWVAACAFVVFVSTGYRLTSQDDGKVPEKVLHRPSPIPDRIILTWADEPSSTQTVTWRTDTSVSKAAGEIAEAEDGPGFVKKARQFPAAMESFESDLNQANYHSITFRGLKPNTQYVYRVGNGANWSEWNQFRTAAAGPAPLEFIYVGDAQTNIWDLWSRLIRQGYTEAPKTRFIIHAGDLVNRAHRDAEWGEWHLAAGWINRSIPSVPAPGNHEYGGRRLAPHWRPQYTLPQNGLPDLAETNYFYDIQGVRVVVLNSNVQREQQAEWLNKLLANNPSKWTVATFHHPIFSSARGRDNKELREVWQPIFDKYRVDLVMTGHDHTYARTNLVTGTNVQSGKAGTVYVVSVSGPKMYKLERNDRMQRAAQDTQLFQVVRIDGDKLVYESRTARGVLYDSFELQKRRGQANKLINRVPSIPERLGNVTD
ncbi:MAG: metallophosphoesterase family protein [Bryobacterales bacterium]|nr:metallophosphoesterase family protein [Bryobacterales bacterium]